MDLNLDVQTGSGSDYKFLKPDPDPSTFKQPDLDPTNTTDPDPKARTLKILLNRSLIAIFIDQNYIIVPFINKFYNER